MERRHYPRIPIDVSVLATGPKHPPLVCRMRDFCEGGALLVLTERDAGLIANGRLGQDDPLDLRFTVDVDGRKQRLQLKAEIAHAYDDNLGVSFPSHPPAVVVDALTRLSEQTFPQTSGSSSAQAAKGQEPSPQAKVVLRGLQAYAENKLPWRVGQFFHEIVADLVEAASVAANSQEEQLIFELTREIPVKQGPLKARFRQGLLQGFEQIEEQLDRSGAPPKERAPESGLSLVDKDEFDDWVHVVAIINRGEGLFAEELFIITHVLSDLLGIKIDRDNNPIGPSIICQAFHAACQELETPQQMKRRIYWMFEKQFVPEMSSFYKGAVEVFTTHGVSTEVNLAVQRRSESGAGGRKNGHSEDRDMSAEVREALRQHDQEVSAAQPLAPDQTPEPRPAPAPAPAEAGVLSAAKRLFGLISGRRSRETRRSVWDEPSFEELGGVAPEAAMPAEIPEVELLDESDVGALIDALDAMQEEDQAATGEASGEAAPRAQLGDRVLQAMAEQQASQDGHVRVGQQEMDLVQMVDTLLEHVHGDLMVDRSIQRWLRKLEVPLLKAAAVDPELLAGGNNPFALVMNELEHLGRVTADTNGKPDPRISTQVDEILAGLATGGHWDAKAMEAAAVRLAALTEGQRVMVDRTVDRTIQAHEGQQRLLDARTRVEEEIQNRFDGIALPSAVIRMVNEGWRPILVQALLRAGKESPEWESRVGVVSQLADPRRYAGKRWNDPERPQIMAMVRAELEKEGAALPNSQALIRGLEEAFDGQVSPLEWEDYRPQQETGQTLPPTFERALLERPEHLSEEAWRDLLEQALELKVDSWVSFDRGDGQRQPLRLVWTGKEHRWFLFANNRGAKAEELTLPELALQFSNGDAAITEDLDLSLMDRASQKMLEQLHQEIAEQAARDPLTGLLNRREFENRVEQSVAAAVKDQMHLVLMHIDLDQFRLVNITFSFQAGDQYLQHIAEIIKGRAGPTAIAARMGDDTFGLLLPNCTQERGMQVAESLRREIQSFRFIFKEGKPLSLTVSIGATSIAPDRADPERALKEAEAACDLAKEQGRNRVEFYHAEDPTLSDRYQLAVRVTDVMEAMQKNRLQLAGQQIMPIGTGGHRPLVEILVRLPDAEEHSAEYLRAVEYFNRITEVDRWVVQQVFDWMRRMGKRLGLLDCCAINISANSLHDVDFPDYVRSALGHHQIPADKVCFELSEAAVTDNARRVQQAIRALKQTGCRFSVDDFGIGSAAFSHLKKVPAEYIKIAGGIVSEIAHNKDDLAMVKSINEVAHYLGKQTIAENVTSQESLNVLKEIGVDYAQGPLISLPKVLTQD